MISASPAGERVRDLLAAAWPGHLREHPLPATDTDGPYAPGLPEDAAARVARECAAEERIVCVLGTGPALRLLAPLLRARTTAPAVVCVDEDGRYAVPLLAGPGQAARELAAAVAGALPGCVAVPAAAGAPTGVPVLDSLGWPVEGAAATVGRAFLSGTDVAVCDTVEWPLPALPPNVRATGTAPGEGGGPGLWITDQVVATGPTEAVLRPPTLGIGLGTCRGTAAAEIVELIEQALDDAGLSARCVAELATLDIRADEPGPRAAAERFGVPLRTYPAGRLTAVPVPNPSRRAGAMVGTPSVAEAAALLAADGYGELVVPKVASRPLDGSPARATAAVTRRRPLRPRTTGATAGQAAGGQAAEYEKPEVSDVHVV
nr:cobalamin biosynthesis protein [Streptomyces sp. HNM0574]